MKALINRLREREKHLNYLVWAQVIDMLRLAIRDKELIGRYDYVLNNLCTAECLAIDDIGMGTTDTPFELAALERIIVTRFENNLLTALISNLEITSLPDRVQGRLEDKTRVMIVLNKASNYRGLKGVKDTARR